MHVQISNKWRLNKKLQILHNGFNLFGVKSHLTGLLPRAESQGFSPATMSVQGSALSEPGGLWRLTFALLLLSFFHTIIYWIP